MNFETWPISPFSAGNVPRCRAVDKNRSQVMWKRGTNYFPDPLPQSMNFKEPLRQLMVSRIPAILSHAHGQKEIVGHSTSLVASLRQFTPLGFSHFLTHILSRYYTAQSMAWPVSLWTGLSHPLFDFDAQQPIGRGKTTGPGIENTLAIGHGPLKNRFPSQLFAMVSVCSLHSRPSPTGCQAIQVRDALRVERFAAGGARGLRRVCGTRKVLKSDLRVEVEGGFYGGEKTTRQRAPVVAEWFARARGQCNT